MTIQLLELTANGLKRIYCYKIHCLNDQEITTAKKGKPRLSSLHVKEPGFLLDPSHHQVCVFLRPCILKSRSQKCNERKSKADFLRLKLYYGCFIKKNRDKTNGFLRSITGANPPHLQNTHNYCHAEWCPVKANKIVSTGKYWNIDNIKENIDRLLVENVGKRVEGKKPKALHHHSICK